MNDDLRLSLDMKNLVFMLKYAQRDLEREKAKQYIRDKYYRLSQLVEVRKILRNIGIEL